MMNCCCGQQAPELKSFWVTASSNSGGNIHLTLALKVTYTSEILPLGDIKTFLAVGGVGCRDIVHCSRDGQTSTLTSQ